MRMGFCVLILIVGTGCSGFKCCAPTVDVPCHWHSSTSESMEFASPDGFNWWESLNDPVLNDIMERASLQNPGLQLAALGAKCSAENYRQAWSDLSAEVANSYIELRGLQLKLDLNHTNIESQKEMLQLTEGLTKTGFTSTTDQKQAEELLNNLMAERPQIELAIQKAIYHLSVLAGYAPGDLACTLAQRGDLPLLPNYLPIGLPCDILGRRPDVLKVERALRSPFCNSQTTYLYQKTVLEALEEAENALATFHFTQARTQELAKSLGSSHDAFQTMHMLYQRGLKDYAEVLASHRTYISAQEAYLQGRVDLLLAYVGLYKALAANIC